MTGNNRSTRNSYTLAIVSLCFLSPSAAALANAETVAANAAESLAAGSTRANGATHFTPQDKSAANAAYERATRVWRSLKTLEVRFEQRITNPLIRRSAVSHGTFVQQRPNKVAITFTDPVGDKIVGDGKFLWVYLPSSAPGQVMKLPADAEGAVVADLLGQLLDSPRQAFEISGGNSVQIEGRSTRSVLLVPKNIQSSPFQRATLWIDDKDSRPVRIQVIDAQGVDRSITLQTWSPNVAVARDAFNFAVPKDAKIVTKL